MRRVPLKYGRVDFVRETSALEAGIEGAQSIGGVGSASVPGGRQFDALLGLSSSRTLGGQDSALSRSFEFSPPAGDADSPPLFLPNSPPVASFLNPQGYVLADAPFRADTSFPADGSPGLQEPVIEPLGSTGFVVIWTASDGGSASRGVFRQAYDSSAAPVGTASRVNNTAAGDQAQPDVAALSGGGYVVAWEGYDGSMRGIYARRYDAAGGPDGNEFLINTITSNDEFQPAVAGLPGGGFVVAWGSSNGSARFQMYDSSGARVGSETSLVNTFSSFGTDVSALAGGGFVVSWRTLGQLSARVVGSDGSLGATVVVATSGAVDRTTVEALPGGGFVVVWEATVSNQVDVLARVYNASFAPVGDAFFVNQNRDGTQDNPSANALPDGGFLVSWQSDYLSASNNNLFVRKFGADGTPLSSEVELVAGTGNQLSPDLALVGDKTFLLWRDVTNQAINGQRFEPVFTGYTSTEQVATNLKGSLGISDSDAGSSIMTVTLSVGYGIIVVDAGSSGATVTNSGTGTVTIQGTIAQINALLATDATSALSYVPNTDTPPTGATLTFTVSDGLATDTASAPIAITVTDDLPTAVPDAAAVDENATINIAALANDPDPDGGTRRIVEVNGDPLSSGQFVQLASGAGLTLEFDGTFTYDPAGAFNYLAGNATASDSFTYALNGGSVTAVTVTIRGIGTIVGDSGDNAINGTPQNDYIDLSQGGDDDASGNAGDDGFYLGAAFTGADSIDGGTGSNDQMGLDGNYGSAGAPFVLNGNMANVEAVVLMPGAPATPNSFNLSVTDSAVLSGQSLTIFALQTSTGVVFDGSNEHDGAFRLYGGSGNDIFTGGDGNDWLFGSAGQDTLNGGAGADTYFYQAVSESTGPTYDRIDGFVSGTDKIDLPGTVAAVDPTVTSGTLNSASFNSNLAAAIQASQLQAGDAVLFKPDAGTLAGTTFLIVDANGVAGYQADADYVIQLINPPAILQTSDFI